MLISVNELTKFWDVSPQGVIHVGAHEAEESVQYSEAKWGKVYWVEAQPDKVKFLKKKFANSEDLVFDAAVWSKPGIPLDLQVMTNSASTSLLNLGTHNEAHPDIKFSHSIKVTTQILEDIIPSDSIADYLCLDIQGAELEALRGFGARVKELKWIYSEVNKDELYEGCCLVSELDDYLSSFGFIRSATRWTEFGWGDALYVNKNVDIQTPRHKILLWKALNSAHYANRMIRTFLRPLVSWLRVKK
jgi:FkbM family methyltransferase